MRGISFLYRYKRLKKFTWSRVAKIDNKDLMNYGFRDIGNRLTFNKNLQYVCVSGVDYEYMAIDEVKIKRINKLLKKIRDKSKVVFFELNKVKISSGEIFKNLLDSLSRNLTSLRYLTI